MKKLIISSVIVVLFGIGFYWGYVYFDEEDSSESIVSAIEKVRGENFVNYLIHEAPVEGGRLVFFTRSINDGQIQTNAEFVKKTRHGWKWGYGGSFGSSNLRLDLTPEKAEQETFLSCYFPSTKGTEFSSPFPMVYGVILNPHITSIVVKDYVTGLERQTEVVEVNEHFKLFYTLLDEEQGKKFELIGFNRQGEIVHTETIDEGMEQQSGTEKIGGL
jgi:hypothetical protein